MSDHLACPDCPLCGNPPEFILTGGVQAFCGDLACRVMCWNPSATRAENMADLHEVDLDEH